jgi:RNA polymerase sigma factor (sigma-70 family)
MAIQEHVRHADGPSKWHRLKTGTVNASGRFLTQPTWFHGNRLMHRWQRNLRDRSSDHTPIPRLPTTRLTLLGRLSQDPTNQGAWVEFVERYGRHIYRWCRQWRLQDADADDVAQEILVKLAKQLRDFVYDPSRSFRGWLKTIAHHAWRDFVDSRRRVPSSGGGERVQDLIQSLEAREDLLHRLAEAFDHELLEAAKARVRLRVAPHTWDAFRLVALEGLPFTWPRARCRKCSGKKFATSKRARHEFLPLHRLARGSARRQPAPRDTGRPGQTYRAMRALPGTARLHGRNL